MTETYCVKNESLVVMHDGVPSYGFKLKDNRDKEIRKIMREEQRRRGQSDPFLRTQMEYNGDWYEENRRI